MWEQRLGRIRRMGPPHLDSFPRPQSIPAIRCQPKRGSSGVNVRLGPFESMQQPAFD